MNFTLEESEGISRSLIRLAKAAFHYRVGIRKKGEGPTQARNRLQEEMGRRLDELPPELLDKLEEPYDV